MELAELMHSHQESMKAAQQEAEARKGRGRPKTVPKPAPKRHYDARGIERRSASDDKLVKHTPEDRELSQTEPSTPQKDNQKDSKGRGDRSPSTPAPAPRRRLRLVDDKADAEKTTKGTKRPVENAAVDLPPKRSARIAEKPLGLPQPKPFNVDLAAKSLAFKRRRSRSGGTEPCEESPNNEMPKSAVDMSEDSGKGANMASVAASEVAKEQQDQKQEVKKKVSLARLSSKVLLDPRDGWQKLHMLMQRLPKSHCEHIGEDMEVANLLEVARRCIGDFSEDPAINFFKLSAANSLLDLAAAIDESGELAPIMTMSIATRGILNVLVQHIGGAERKLLVNLLEPVPTADYLTKLLGHVEELWLKSSLQKTTSPSNSFEVFQKYGSLAVTPDNDPRNLEVATCRPAACAVLALSKTLAMEAADAECHQLVILEARAQVRRASAEAADKAAMELSSSFAQKEPNVRGYAAVAAAAEEAQKEVKEFQRLNADICQGRDILKSWTSLLEAQRPPPEVSGRPVDVSATDWARMKDGQHLNDSLIDLFVSMLVGLLGGSRMHAFSSHFYTRLAGPADGDESGIDQGWQRVRTWTRAVRRRHVTGIFACDYLLVPLHHEEEHHWSLAVVCRPWAAIAQLDNWVCPSHTTVAFLDSLWSPSSEIRQEIVMKKLCQYLECEWRVCGAVGTFQSSRVEAVAVEVPQQTNNFDCGIYVLEFVLQLLQHPWRLASLGQSQVVLEVCDADPRKRWHDAAEKLRAMKEAAPAAGVESAWFAAQLWLQELQKPKAVSDQPQS